MHDNLEIRIIELKIVGRKIYSRNTLKEFKVERLPGEFMSFVHSLEVNNMTFKGISYEDVLRYEEFPNKHEDIYQKISQSVINSQKDALTAFAEIRRYKGGEVTLKSSFINSSAEVIND